MRSRAFNGTLALATLTCAAVWGQGEPVVGTLAGSGWPGYFDAFGRNAEFQVPAGMALVGTQLIVADSQNNVLRAIDVDTGEVSTFAGTGTAGLTDGPLLQAEFDEPRDVYYWEEEDALIVADAGNHAIRAIILPVGQVITIAGTGDPGWLDGPGDVAQFNQPSATVVMDPLDVADSSDGASQSTGLIFVADTSNHVIRVIDLFGEVPAAATGDPFAAVVTVAGLPEEPGFEDGGGEGYALFNGPMGLLASPDGLIVADTGNHALRAIDPMYGGVITVMGDGSPGDDDGPLDEARLNRPIGLFLDETLGLLTIADSGNHRLRGVVDVDGAELITLVGDASGYEDAILADALLDTPWDGLLLPSTVGDGASAMEDVIGFFTDSQNHAVRTIGYNNPPVADPDGPYSVGPGEWMLLWGLDSYDPDIQLGDDVEDWAWDLDDDGYFDEFGPVLLLDPWLVWMYFGDVPGTAPYLRTITLEVMDHYGATHSAQTTVTVVEDLGAPLAPTLMPEPPWTRGTENTLYWETTAPPPPYSSERLFELQWSRRPDFRAVLGSLVTNEQHATAAPLGHNKDYHYRVREVMGYYANDAAANGVAGGGPWSNIEWSIQDARAPNSKILWTSNPMHTQRTVVPLEWASVESGSGFDFMRLYYCHEGGPLTRYPGKWEPDASVKGTLAYEEVVTGHLAFDALVAAGEGSYDLFLSGVDQVKNIERISATPQMVLICDFTPPQITEVEVKNITRTSAEVHWRTDERTTGRVRYGKNRPYHKSDLSAVPARSHMVTLTGLTPETLYYFQVIAWDRGGNETKSKILTFTTLDEVPGAPILRAEPPFTKGTENELSWTMAAVVRDFVLEWADDSAFTNPQEATTSQTSYTATGLQDGVEYFYRVAARNRQRVPGPWSNVESSIQDASPPTSAITTLSPVTTNADSIEVQWASQDSGSGPLYVEIVYRKDDGPMTLYPGQFMPDTTAGAGANPIAGTATFDADTAGGDGRYKLWAIGTDAVGNVEQAVPPAQFIVIFDRLGPAVSDVRVRNITQTTADIHWQTDEKTTGQADYGPTTTYGATEGSRLLGLKHSVTLTGLTPETLYHFRITVVDKAGNGAASADHTFETKDETPGQPMLNAEPEFTPGTENSLSWNGVAEVIKYLLQWADNGGFTGAQEFKTAKKSATATGLQDGTTYYYRVAGINRDGLVGPWSEVEQSTQDDSPPSTSTTNRSPVFVKADFFDVFWEGSDATSGIDFVELVYRKDDGPEAVYPERSSPATLVASSVQGSIRFDADRAGGDGQYKIWARGTDNVGNQEEPSGPAQLVVTFDRGAPKILEIDVRNIGQTSAEVHWRTNERTIGHVDYGETTAYTGTEASTAWDYRHSVLLTGLSPGTTYHYAVTAEDKAGNTHQSKDRTFTTRDTTPGAPILDGEPQYTQGTQNTLSWSAVSVVAGYMLQWADNSGFADRQSLATTAKDATLTGLIDGVTYYYRVAAVNRDGLAGAWSNVESSTQDASPPDTSVALADTATALLDPMIKLDIAATDPTSGVESVELYFAKDRGAFQLEATLPPATTEYTFNASPHGGGRFAFYTTGEDNVGNVEDPPSPADVEVDVLLPTTLTYIGDLGTTQGEDALLAATLEDSAGSPVPGATVTYKMSSLSGSLPPTDSRGFTQATVRIDLEPRAYRMRLGFGGDSTRQPSEVKVTFVVKPPASGPDATVTVTGDGTIVAGNDTYSFEIDVANSPLAGTVKVTLNGKVIEATSITSVSAIGSDAIVTGLCTVNGVGSYRFVVRATDGAPDSFGITTTEGTFLVLAALSSGDVTVTSTP